MALETTLAGTVTWDGTSTVLMTDTSQVAVNDWIKFNATGHCFKILTVTANTNVTIDNPESVTIPSGTGGIKDDAPIMYAIKEAGDFTKTPVVEETITEPSAPGGTKRATQYKYTSATVYASKKVTVDVTYSEGAGSAAWCKQSAHEFTVEDA